MATILKSHSAKAVWIKPSLKRLLGQEAEKAKVALIKRTPLDPNLKKRRLDTSNLA